MNTDTELRPIDPVIKKVLCCASAAGMLESYAELFDQQGKLTEAQVNECNSILDRMSIRMKKVLSGE